MVDQLSQMLLPVLGALHNDDPEPAFNDLAPDEMPSQYQEKKAKRFMPSCEALKADIGDLCASTLTEDQQQAFDKIVNKGGGDSTSCLDV